MIKAIKVDEMDIEKSINDIGVNNIKFIIPLIYEGYYVMYTIIYEKVEV